MDKELTLYRVKNWSTYNRVLKDRWGLDLWFDQDQVRKWYKKSIKESGACVNKRYSDEAIRVCLTIRCLFNLSLRATQGLMESLIERLGLPIKCPHYSRLCRRASRFARLKVPRAKGSSTFGMIVDSTGLKVYGEGEWKVKSHKASRRRTWRKLHVSVDPVTQQIMSSDLTPSTVGDSSALPGLLRAVPDNLTHFWADGAYESPKVFKALYERGIVPLIPPRLKGQEGLKTLKRGHYGRKKVVYARPDYQYRDRALAYMKEFENQREGKSYWKRASGYYLRSLVETAIMRFKRTFTDKLRSRNLNNQKAEVFLKCSILNKMLSIGFPHTVPHNYPFPSLA